MLSLHQCNWIGLIMNWLGKMDVSATPSPRHQHGKCYLISESNLEHEHWALRRENCISTENGTRRSRYFFARLTGLRLCDVSIMILAGCLTPDIDSGQQGVWATSLNLFHYYPNQNIVKETLEPVKLKIVNSMQYQTLLKTIELCQTLPNVIKRNWIISNNIEQYQKTLNNIKQYQTIKLTIEHYQVQILNVIL